MSGSKFVISSTPSKFVITGPSKADMVDTWAGCAEPNYQVSGDIRDIAETIKDLVSGIDGEALSEELIRLSEEVQCMEEG